MNQFVTQLHMAFTMEDRGTTSSPSSPSSSSHDFAILSLKRFSSHVDRSTKLNINEVAAALARENLRYDVRTLDAFIKKFSKNVPQPSRRGVLSILSSFPFPSSVY